jgi:heat shock protein HtpX
VKLTLSILKSIFLLALMLLAVVLVFLQFISVTGLEILIYNNFAMFESFVFILVLLIFTGSVINLFFPKWILQHLMKVRFVSTATNTSSQQLSLLLESIANQQLIKTPALAVYDSQDINAFTTGYDHHNAIVVVSSGLLYSLNHDEQEAVLAHEVTHIVNHDMLTLSLMHSVLNVIVMLPCHLVGWAFDKKLLGRKNIHGPAYITIWSILQVTWGILATMLVMWFSRWREFRADKGAAEIVGKHKMQSALACLKAVREHHDLPDEIGAFGISGHIGRGVKRLFVSHPPLTERIAALKEDWH